MSGSTMPMPMDVRLASTDSIAMFDAEKYRKSYESRREWGLRKAFLEAHYDTFPEDRLLCLSHCFINVEMYGCSYPGPVMEQLNGLAASIQDRVDSYRAETKAVTEVKFVKASDSSDKGPVAGPSTSYSSKPVHEMPYLSNKKPKAPLMFVKAGSDFKSTDYKQGSTSSTLPPQHKTKFISSTDGPVGGASGSDSELVKFKMLGKHLITSSPANGNVVSNLHLAMDKMRMTAECDYKMQPPKQGAPNPGFCCSLKINFVLVASGNGNSKKDAKQTAYAEAITKLSQRYVKILTYENDAKELLSSSTPFQDNSSSQPDVTQSVSQAPVQATTPVQIPVSRKRMHPRLCDQLSSFLLMESLTGSGNTNSVSIIRQSADFNKWPLNYEFTQLGNQTKCEIFLSNLRVIDCLGENKVHVKSVASDKLLEQLRDICWTVKIKKNEDTEDSGLTRDEILGDVAKQSQVIPESNVGSMLLKKMGWSGGGVGKVGREGRATPVSVHSVINRQGLGLQAEQGVTKSFVQSVKTILDDYVKSDKQGDLSFSPEFGNEERAIVHREANKLGLKSGSKGSGEERYLIISRKRTAGQLFDHIVQSGGATSKYELVPPAGSLAQ